MTITPATGIHAPSKTTATAKAAPWIERYIGQQVAGAAACLLLALEEYRDGGLSPRTKAQSGELIFEIFRLQQYTAGTLDFDAIARTQGIAALRADDITLATAEIAVDEVLKILAKVIRDQLN